MSRFATLLSLGIVISSAGGCVLDWSKRKDADAALPSDGSIPLDPGSGDASPDLDGHVESPEATTSCIPPGCDPCAQEPPVCQNGGSCSATTDGYECACPAGYSGTTCDVDACEATPCQHGTCVRTAAGRVCDCEPKWTGDACEQNMNAELASLSVSAGKLFPPFSPDIHEYSIDLGISTPSISLIPSAMVPEGVEIDVDGEVVSSGVASKAIPLTLNTPRKVLIKSTSSGGAHGSYEITIRRTLALQQTLTHTTWLGVIETVPGHPLAIEGDLIVAATGLVDDKRRGGVRLFARLGSSWADGGEVWPRLSVPDRAMFGQSIRLTKDWLVVGAPDDNQGVGAVYVVRRPDLLDRGAWQRLDPPDTGTVGFGRILDISENLLIVGSFPQTTGVRPGVVYMFEADAGSWEARTSITPPPDIFGFGETDLALEAGLVAITGTDEDNYPVVFAYEQGPSGWQEAARLQGESPMSGTSLAVSQGRIAGSSAWLCLGSPWFDGSCIGSPDVTIFDARTGWTATKVDLGSPVDMPEAVRPNGFGLFGVVLAGSIMVSSAHLEAGGLTGVNPTRNGTIDLREETGAVYMFEERAGKWSPSAYLKPPSLEHAQFGSSFAVSGDTLVVAQGSNNLLATGGPGVLHVYHVDCAQVPAGADVPGC